MSRSTETLRGRAALVVGHCAGMIDIVALPVWVGIVLIGQYGLEPQAAGMLATLFLGAVVVSSLFFSPRIRSIRGTVAAPVGFAIAATGFAALATTRDYGAMVALHLACGLAVGCSLSFTHSTIGASANPHRLIAVGFTALSVVSLAFLGGVPRLVNAAGGASLFLVLGAIMSVAALFALFGFPTRRSPIPQEDNPIIHVPLARGVWFAMIGTSFMTMNNAMLLSFLEPVGAARGFGKELIMAVLLAVGLVNLVPGVLAAILESRISARAVMLFGPVLQGVLGVLLTHSTLFPTYAVTGALFPAVLIFAHTFVFAFLARNDPSTRAVAATPVMAMAGSAVGPIVGGIAAQNLGYESIGMVVAAAAAIGTVCFWQAWRSAPAALPSTTPVL
ncbi:MFS transporter [Cupriavidus necator]|uniref:MFS transporter n=1 Tax=Cupriavidus necator TaxID=106590 RepID=UPI001E47D141|nr:MFS transporter [Cupriavidus necator]